MEEVDEIQGESAGVELARVEAQHSPEGLTLTSTFNASRIQELKAAASRFVVGVRDSGCGDGGGRREGRGRGKGGSRGKKRKEREEREDKLG